VSIFKPVGKAAKFTFVTAPLSIFGWQLNKRLFMWLRSFWSRSVNPACPKCDEGVLISQSSVAPVFDQSEGGERPRQLYPWVCNHCGFAMLETLAPKAVREVAGRLRMERARSVFSELELHERSQFAQKHQVASRIFFGVSALVFIGCIYMIATGASLILSLNWASFAFMFWVFGMKRSFRAWQVLSGHIFEQGAARYWLAHEKWLI
jgi:uncharacterized membrane protein